jgi:hypothetical protein
MRTLLAKEKRVSVCIVVLLVLLIGISASDACSTYSLSAGDPVGISIDVKSGTVVEVDATGMVHTNPGGDVVGCDLWAGPDGLPACYYVSGVAQIHGLSFMALVGNMDGRWFFVGRHSNIVVEKDTVLRLVVNDWIYSDNAGSFKVTIGGQPLCHRTVPIFGLLLENE